MNCSADGGLLAPAASCDHNVSNASKEPSLVATDGGPDAHVPSGHIREDISLNKENQRDLPGCGDQRAAFSKVITCTRTLPLPHCRQPLS